MEWETVIGVAVAGAVSVCSVVLGGAITLIGTVLAWWLGRRADREQLREERINERLDEVSDYFALLVEYGDWVCIPSYLQGEKLEGEEYEAWGRRGSQLRERLDWMWRMHARVPLIANDKQLRELVDKAKNQVAELSKHLEELDKTRVLPAGALENQKTLREAAEKSYKRIEELRP